MLEFSWQTYAWLGAGMLFLVLEVLIPSGGLLGIGSAVCLILGGYACFRQAGWDALLGYGLIVAVLAPTTAIAAFAVLPKTPMGKAIILQSGPKQRREATETGLAELLGARGVAATPLRPAGIAQVGDRRVDVVTRGQHLEAGDRLKVLKVEGNRVIVDRDADGPPQAS